MKGKKLLAGVLSAAMVLGTMAFPAFAEENPGTDPVKEFMSLKAQNVYVEHEIDLKGATVNITEPYYSNIYADITIKNGTINFSGFETPDGIFRIGYWSCDHPVTLTLEDMTINVTNVTASTGVFTMQNQDDTLVLNNSTINATEITNTPGIFYTPNCVDSVRGSVEITGGRMNIETDSALFFNNDVDLGNTEISCTVGRPVFRQSAGSVENTTITVKDVIDGATRGIVEDIAGNPDGTVEFKNSNVNAPEGQVLVKTNTPGKILAVADNASTYTVGETVKPMASEETGVQLFTASIGDNYYISLEDAMQAACNMNVEDVYGVPTQTAPVTIDLVSDIENQEGFSVRGGVVNANGEHYVHNVDITLNGNGHKIDTGVYGCNNVDSNPSPKIKLGSIGGKFSVKNVIAPNDLIFAVAEPDNDNISACRMGEGGADSLTVEDCTFYGSNMTYPGAVKTITYKNNKFLLTENVNDNPDAYPLWYKFDWESLEKFTFEGNTVKSQRALNLARFSENCEIDINNNDFAVENSETPAKSAAIMLAENHTDQHPYNGNLTFNGNAVDAHSAVLVYAPSEYNTNFNLTAESNILANGTKLVGYNEWSGTYNDQTAKEAAETLVKKVETNANGSATVADTLKLTFKKHADDERVYDIVLNGDGKDINRLNAAEFEFELSNAAMTYEIKAADKLTTLQPDADKYVFYFDGKDAVNNADTGSEITIGTVTFEGFGKFTFKATAGKATATTTADNLVTEFVTTTAAGKGALKIGEDDNMIKDAEIKVPTQKLTVNVAMEHNVGDNTEAYQDMTVAISGGDLAGKVLEYKLGDAANTAITKAINGTMVASYQIKADLTKERIYTVTVSGAGYRTSRYTVTMTEDKTMNFWNNDKTNEVTVIDDEKAKTTFLAGELVRDGKIDIYDLSAVVAYFGQKNIDRTQASKFAKYDLNRDGEIDIMDISIVLTSWGK